MAWIESHQTLREHPKLTVLAEKLSICKAQAIGHLHLLWWWCIDYAVDGRLERWSPPQIASAAGWQGNSGAFIQALADGGFLDRDPLRVHDWLDFCGDLIKKRLEYKKEKRRRSKRLGDSLRKTEISQPTVPAVPYRTNQTNQTSPAQGSAVAELISLFHLKLTEALGEKPPKFNGGALGRFLKAALTSHPVGDVKGRIEFWFCSTDPFIVSNGYSPTLFTSKFPLLKGGPIHAGKNASNVRLAQHDQARRSAYPD